MDTAYISDIGLLRKNNEDHYLVMDEYGLFAVCDGMGGHKGGDVASKMAVDCLHEYMLNLAADSLNQNPISVLNAAIQKANHLIWLQAQGNSNLHEMGTTITAAIIRKKQLTVANVGDSSLYIFRNGKLVKVTRDHTLAEKMVADGLLKNEDKKSSGYNHILTRALGIQEEVVIDNFEQQLYRGDLVLLCSDGLTDMLDDNEIETILNQEENLQKSLNTLLDTALTKGGYDNITIILLRI
jgi:serine/threonine protein phosphatase PrpC